MGCAIAKEKAAEAAAPAEEAAAASGPGLPARAQEQHVQHESASVSDPKEVGVEVPNPAPQGDAEARDPGPNGDPEEEEDVEALLAADEARLAREAAEPLPEGSQWYACGGAELEPHMAHTTMLRASWLLKLAKREVMPEREGVIPPWQLVPPEATVGLAELRRSTMALQLPVAITSYGWAAQRHPDPTGEQLQRLVPALEAMVHSCTHGKDELAPDQRAAEWGIVWDCTPRRRARTTAPAPADPEPPTSTPARARSIPPPAARC